MRHSRNVRPWHPATWAVLGVAGLIFVTSAISSDGVDLRASSVSTLSDLARSDTAEYKALSEQQKSLGADVQRLAKVPGATPSAARDLRRLRQATGMSPLRGPGITVTLSDAPAATIKDSGLSPSVLIVHQQDVQAVMNALWVGGARGLTVQGRRVISTTGVKCVGNSIIVAKIPYAQPYVITAVGDPAKLNDAVLTDAWMQYYFKAVPRGLGFRMESRDAIRMPAYENPVSMTYATAQG